MDRKQVERLGIIIAVILLGIVIIIHEFGHFLLAKANGVVVEEFSVGMGPRLLSKVIGGTRYSLKLIPFGGSCMMKGEDEGDTSEGTFNSKSVWARISVIVAGPFFNFILAFIGALFIIRMVGYDTPRVLQVAEGSPEQEAGLLEGDIIKEYNGKSISLSRELYSDIAMKGIPKGENTMTVLRNGEEHKIAYKPASTYRYMLGFTYQPTEELPSVTTVSPTGVLAKAGMEAGDYIYSIDDTEIENGLQLEKYLKEHPLDGTEITIGYLRDGLEYTASVTPEAVDYQEQGFSFNMQREKTSFLNGLKYSLFEVKYWISSTLEGFKMLFSGKIGMDSLSGPVGVVNFIGDTYKESKKEGGLITWLEMINMMILISTNLGVLNLVPFPALDGGRLVFLLIEAVRGKAINQETEGKIHFAGMMILMAFIIFITVRDIVGLF